MASYQGGRKHLAQRSGRRTGAWVATIVVVVALGIGGGWYARYHGPVKNLGCSADTITLNVVSSPEKYPILKQAAGDYARTNPRIDGRCITVQVASKPSGDAANALTSGWNAEVDGPRPDVWSPASTGWAGLVSGRLAAAHEPDIVPADKPSIASSPLVMAMPRPMAEAIGWPDRPVGWSDVLKVLSSGAGWKALGHPEWGPFLIGKLNPNLSDAGLQSAVGAFYVASAQTGQGMLSAEAMQNKEVQGLVLALNRTPGPVTDTAATFLANLQHADDQGKALAYTSIVPLDEKSVLDYNQGNPSGDPATLGRHPKPKVPLAAVYPKEGTLTADHPYVVVKAPWVDAAKRDAAAEFLHYLQSGPVQAAFQAAGFRSYSGVAGDLANQGNGLIATQPGTVLPMPAAPLVTAIMLGWNASQKTANIVALLDISGSMNEKVAGTGGKTKLDILKATAVRGLFLFHGVDNLSDWAFSSQLNGTQDFRPLVPYGPLDQQLVASHTRREVLAAAILKLQAHGDTGLYDSISAAYKFVQAHYTPGRINTVVALTDGINDDPTGGITLPTLLAQLKAGYQKQPVRVVTIGFGSNVDPKALGAIAKAANGGFFYARNPADVDKIFLAALASF